ncbi:MAG: hypothetical protein ACM3ZV_04335 [Bacillota bacterium]
MLPGADRAILIILDFSMPGMTASVMPSHVAKLRELGAVDVLRKPFDPLTLADQIRAAWMQATRSSN